MIRLRTLGVLDLKEPDGSDFDRVLAQPKRLALLVYLALARSRRFRRRDSALALFWPDLDEEHARGALRQAVRFLRRSLGEGILVGRGDEELALAEGALWCDAKAFEEACSAGRPAEALDLYRGDFLDGFHVSDAAPELEEWIAQERARLRRLAADATWELAGASRRIGDATAAARWARRAVSLTPDDEGELRRLLRWLDEMGDRAAALQAYDLFSHRLAELYEAEPSADTQALVRELRSRPAATVTPAAAPAPATGDGSGAPGGAVRAPTGAAAAGAVVSTRLTRPHRSMRVALAVLAGAGALAVGRYLVAFRPNSAPPLDPSLIVVGMFENRTGDAAFDPVSEMAADWVTRGLMQTGLVGVVDARPWVEFSQLADSIRGRGAAGARVLAAKTGAGTVVWGNLYRQGERLEFQAHITDAQSGKLLRSVEPATGPAEEPLTAVDELRARVTGSLATVVDPELRSWVGLASQPPDFEAYREFLRGVDAHYAWNFRDALPLYLKAAARDSSFTLPLAMASHVAWKSGRCDLTDSIGAELAPVRERLPLFDRSQLEWALAACHGDMRAGLQAARRAREIAPGSDYVAWVHAWWAMRNRLPREALATLERLDPGSGFFFGRDLHLVAVAEAYHSLGAYRDELKAARRYRQRFGDRLAPIIYEIEALAALHRRREVESLLGDAERLGSDPNATAANVLLEAARELAAHGHPDESRKAAERAVAWLGTHAPRQADDARHQLAYALYLAGRWAEAERAYAGIAAGDPGDYEVAGLLGILAARRGDRAGAERIAGDLASLPEPYLPGNHTLWRARIAGALGDREQAVALLRQAYGEGLPFRGRWHADPEWDSLRDYAPFLELVRVED